MKRSGNENLEQNRLTFDKVVEYIILKNKNMYKELIKSGPLFKDAIFRYMSKMISTEKIPNAFSETTLIQIWKGKGSALDLNNMRFIHMRHWTCKLLEALVTEKMKPNIVQNTPKIQIGGMPKHSSVEHLVVLKTWMKQLEQTRTSGIFQTFDMSKFFDKESLIDCMYTLDKVAKIDNKCYRIWYKINENTRIRVQTSVGLSGEHNIHDSVGQGQVGAALVSSLNIGHGIYEIFKDNFTAKIGKDIQIDNAILPGVSLNSIIFQDDIGKLNNNIDQAREACELIDDLLKRKQLSANYDKSKFITFGNKTQRDELKSAIKQNPIQMGDSILGNSVTEKYLGDFIHESGCAMSISTTIEDRIRKLKSKCTEIIQLAESPAMSITGNSLPAFKLYESTIVPSLLHNCESWVSLNERHIKDLQNFQNDFIKNVLRLPDSTPKAILQYDVGLMPMKWRIAQKKLLFVNKILRRDPNNICKQVLISESLNNIKGLGHECKLLCTELGLPNIFLYNFKKFEITNAIDYRIKSESLTDLLACKKVADRVSDNPVDNNYLKFLPLFSARVWFRYRARAIKGVKYNTKSSNLNNLNCRFCRSGAEETQEHLEICSGTEQERRKLPNMSTDCNQLLRFWIRMTKKLSNYNEKNQSNANNSIVISSNPVIDSNSASNVHDDNIVESSSSSNSLGSLISLVSCDGHHP